MLTEWKHSTGFAGPTSLKPAPGSASVNYKPTHTSGAVSFTDYTARCIFMVVLHANELHRMLSGAGHSCFVTAVTCVKQKKIDFGSLRFGSWLCPYGSSET